MIKRSLIHVVDTALGDLHRWRFHQFIHLSRSLRNKMPHRRSCNICGFEGFFEPRGWPPRPEAKCPNCLSLERHRLFKIWFDANAQLLADTRLLHFAPEPSITRFVRPSVQQYLTADISPGRADLALNIERIELPDASVDTIICFHVLEHVDDQRALWELHRILRPGGVLLLMFPIVEGWDATYDNPQIETPHDRLLHFGQENHVRYFGADARSRIRAAGFRLQEHTSDNPEQISRHGLIRGEKLFVSIRV